MEKPVLNKLDSDGFINEFIIENKLTEIDKLFLVLALVPYILALTRRDVELKEE